MLQEIEPRNRRGRPRRFLIDHEYELPRWGKLTLVWVTVPMPEARSYNAQLRAKWKAAGCMPDEMLVDIRLNEEGLRRLLSRARKVVPAQPHADDQPDLFGGAA